MINIKKLCTICFGATIISLWPLLPTEGRELKLSVYPILTAPEGNCPEFITVNEESDPYYEGGYTLRGKAELSDIAHEFVITSQDIFSTTWSAVLKSEYENCNATGRITEVDGEYLDYHSYLKVRFIAGQLILIADFTGLNDANNYTPVLLESGVNDGNPFWSWGGTD
jgi:hypothetical protein